jgi:ATP-dependent Clp protease adaptor protein ClpS
MSVEIEDQVEMKTRLLPPHNVILLNDDDHSYAYVIVMLNSIFGFPAAKGFQHAKEVDATGRSIVFTGSKEVAELKQEQIHAFGPDPSIARCKGSMSAIIEPAN